MIVVSNKHLALTSSLIEAGAINHSLSEPFTFSKKSGFLFHWQVAKEESSSVSYHVEDSSATNNAGGNPRGIAYIAKQGITASAPDWVPLTLLARPFAEEDGSLRCTLSLATGTLEPKTLVKAEETIPLGGSLVWASTNGVKTGFAQVVVLRNTGERESKDGAKNEEAPSGTPQEAARRELREASTLNNSATGSLGELPSASEQPDAAKRTYGWLAEQAPEWQQSWGMRQPSPPFKLPHTNLTEYGAQMITAETLFPDPRLSGYRMVGLEPRFVLVPVEGLTKALGGQLPLARPLIIASNELAALTNSLIEAGAVDHSSASPVRFSKMSGGVFHWQVAEGEPSQVMFQTADNPATNAVAASPRQIVFGARHSVPAFAPDWVPLTLLARPFAGNDDSLHSILSLATGEQQPVVLAQAEETIPPGGSLVWASTNEVRAGFAQAVILHNSGPPAEESDESNDGAGEAAAKIQNAKELIEMGKLDEAEALLREAAVSSTAPTEVYYHLDRIQQMKSAGAQRPESLETRVFRVNPNTFYEGLKVVMTNALPTTPARTNAPAPAPIVQGPGGGGIRFLTVTNDMSVVNVAVRDYFEMAGVKFEPPKMIYFNDRTGMLMVKATLADLEIVQRAVEMLNYEPAQVTLEVRTVEATKDDVRAMGFDWLVNPAPEQEPVAGSTVTGILTDPQTRLALSALAERPGVVVRSLPSVTTLSGRQTQIKSSDAVSDNAPAESVIDVIPYVSTDGQTINMAIIPTVTQFLDSVDVENPVNVPSGTDVVISSKPLPRYRLRQIASTVNVWDGQTVVIVYPKVERTRRAGTGRSIADQNVRSLVFITPTIIDPAGNRVHSAEQMPFTQEQVPRQPGQE